ncbi:hypothetical protein MUP77_07130 [Candidatus Bathyarchaeota archaeon]|nr:hypothetical protein [Candidatus Bathyarchaeota archaeon]
MTDTVNTDKAVVEWIASAKSKQTAAEYQNRWTIWLQYCKVKHMLLSGTEQLEDMKKRRLSNDNTEKYLYDNEVPNFFRWLKTEFKGTKTKKPLSENSALAVTTAVRSFFAYHRYTLEIKKDALPSSEKATQTYVDHQFDIYQLRAMFQQGDLRERTILACGKELWLRAGDFVGLSRDLVELTIKREQELAENEHRDTDTVEFELMTEKEKEPCSCHLSKETIELLKDFLKTYPSTNAHLFALTEEALTDLLRRLADKSKITLSGRVRWHCMRKFGITLMHGKVTEPVMKYMVGKHISMDLRTYIQNSRETFKAFKLIEPLISLTKSNGNGSGQFAKQLEELKKERFKLMIMQKLIEKTTPKQVMQNAMEEIERELGITKETVHILYGDPEKTSDLTTRISVAGEALAKKDLERILKENGNNNHNE